MRSRESRYIDLGKPLGGGKTPARQCDVEDHDVQWTHLRLLKERNMLNAPKCRLVYTFTHLFIPVVRFPTLARHFSTLARHVATPYACLIPQRSSPTAAGIIQHSDLSQIFLNKSLCCHFQIFRHHSNKASIHV
jgi:hypothetical protein